MLPKKAGDDIDGELLAKGYYRMLGHLTSRAMNDLTEIVLGECKWFPTIAECRELMGRKSYDNPFYTSQRSDELDRLGYARLSEQMRIAKPARQITDD